MIARSIWQTALLMSLASGAAWATWRWHPQRPELYLVSERAGPGEITLQDALALEQSKGVIWLDARPRAEFNKGHIPGAQLLNVYEWDELMFPFMQLLDEKGTGQTLIIYCDAQKCAASRELQEKLNELPLGELDIRVLHGGWPAWKAAQKK